MNRLIVFFLILPAACSSRTDIPDNIIPPDSMQKIMLDVIVADQYSTMYISKDSLKKDKVKANQDLLETVFKIHHVSRENFQTSLRFYESRPDLNKIIFDSLAAHANIHRPELYRPKPIPTLPAKPLSKPPTKPTVQPPAKSTPQSPAKPTVTSQSKPTVTPVK